MPTPYNNKSDYISQPQAMYVTADHILEHVHAIPGYATQGREGLASYCVGGRLGVARVVG